MNANIMFAKFTKLTVIQTITVQIKLNETSLCKINTLEIELIRIYLHC